MVDGEPFDVVVLGAGPAGLAAACTAAQAEQRTLLIDDNPTSGGQIWRGGAGHAAGSQAAVWLDRARSLPIARWYESRVIAAPYAQALLCETAGKPRCVRYRHLILATGARERFLPFPGWTLPGVTGAAGLQALAKSGLAIAGKSVVVAGSGPLLLAVAAYYRSRGASVPLIAEQAPRASLLRFAGRLLRYPGKAWQALGLRRALGATPYRTSCWPIGATADGGALRVRLLDGGRQVTQVCDYLACGFGLVPNVDVAALLGCEIDAGRVRVDNLQRTREPRVWAAGEITGIGGVDLAIVEGQIAGLAASGQERMARGLFRRRDRARRFAAALEAAFSLRPELRELPRNDTLVCRCEDVCHAALAACSDARDAKLQTRQGMGSCQGRVCGPATQFLFDWQPGTVRPPLTPVAVEVLAAAGPAPSGPIA